MRCQNGFKVVLNGVKKQLLESVVFLQSLSNPIHWSFTKRSIKTFVERLLRIQIIPLFCLKVSYSVTRKVGLSMVPTCLPTSYVPHCSNRFSILVLIFTEDTRGFVLNLKYHNFQSFVHLAVLPYQVRIVPGQNLVCQRQHVKWDFKLMSDDTLPPLHKIDIGFFVF